MGGVGGGGGGNCLFPLLVLDGDTWSPPLLQIEEEEWVQEMRS
jgi:hypothetical protein